MTLLNAFNQNQTWGYEYVNAYTYPTGTTQQVPEGYRHTTDLIVRILSYYSTSSASTVWNSSEPTYDPSPNSQLTANSLQHYFTGSQGNYHPLFVGNPVFPQFAGVLIADTENPDASFRTASHIIHLRKRFSGDISLPSNTSSLAIMSDNLLEDSTPLIRTSIRYASTPGPMVLTMVTSGTTITSNVFKPGAYVVASYSGPSPAKISWPIKDYIDIPAMDSGGYLTTIKIGFLSSYNDVNNLRNTSAIVNEGTNVAGSFSITANNVGV